MSRAFIVSVFCSEVEFIFEVSTSFLADRTFELSWPPFSRTKLSPRSFCMSSMSVATFVSVSMLCFNSSAVFFSLFFWTHRAPSMNSETARGMAVQRRILVIIFIVRLFERLRPFFSWYC